MGTKTISISKDFSPYPAGRFRFDGPYTGEKFRVEYIAAALCAYDHVIVDLTGTLGIGNSFLEEAFGGLVRNEDFTVSELRQRLTIIGGVPSDMEVSWGKIEKAGRCS